MEHFVGIDHGTTYSEAAKIKLSQNLPESIPLGNNEAQIPSALYINDSRKPPEILVGTQAENVEDLEPERVLKWYKPRMEQDASWTWQGRGLTEITSLVLRSMKQDIENDIREPLDEALLTVPAWFHDGARKMTVEAATRAGIKSVILENEPTAAAFFFYQRNRLQSGETVMVYDLGGGTFDTSILRYNADGSLQVLASRGDMDLGGHLWTLRLQAHLAPQYKAQHGLDLTVDPAERYTLYRTCEAGKRVLTGLNETSLRIGSHAGKAGSYPITRAKFDELTRDLLERTGKVMVDALKEAQLDWNGITHVLLVGGTTKMPQVENYISEVSKGKKPQLLGDRDHIVAQGAALLLRQIKTVKPRQVSVSSPAGKATVTIDGSGLIRTVPHNLSTWTRRGNQLRCEVIVAGGTQVPAQGTRRFKRQRDRAAEFDVPVFQGGADRQVIDLKKPGDIQYVTKYRFLDVPATVAEEDEIEVTFQYDQGQMIGVDAIYKPGTSDEKKLNKVEEQWNPGETSGSTLEVPLVVALDCSGSMAEDGKIDDARGELIKIAEQYLPSGFSLSIVDFPHRIFGEAGEVVRGSTDVKEVKKKVSGLVAGGGTPMAEGLALAHEVIKAVSNEGGDRFVILITDGQPNDEATARATGQKISTDGIKLYAIPIGGDANTAFLDSFCAKVEKIESAGGISKAFANLLSGG